MTSGDFEFLSIEVGHGRIVESVYPERVSVSNLAPVIADYFSMWDETTPTAALGGPTRLTHIADEARSVGVALFERFLTRPNFVASAWYTDQNDYAGELWRRLLFDVPSSERAIFATRAEAVAFLEERLERRALSAAHP